MMTQDVSCQEHCNSGYNRTVVSEYSTGVIIIVPHHIISLKLLQLTDPKHFPVEIWTLHRANVIQLNKAFFTRPFLKASNSSRCRCSHQSQSGNKQTRESVGLPIGQIRICSMSVLSPL